MWCIPPKENADFVCAMENVLETYHEPYDPAFPKVCMDETSKQLVDKTTLVREVAAWEKERNGKQKGVDWQFTTANARIKLRQLYPRIRA